MQHRRYPSIGRWRSSFIDYRFIDRSLIDAPRRSTEVAFDCCRFITRRSHSSSSYRSQLSIFYQDSFLRLALQLCRLPETVSGPGSPRPSQWCYQPYNNNNNNNNNNTGSGPGWSRPSQWSWPDWTHKSISSNRMQLECKISSTREWFACTPLQ